MLVELTSDTLAEVIQANKKVAVQFSASWCGNCRIMKPKIQKARFREGGYCLCHRRC